MQRDPEYMKSIHRETLDGPLVGADRMRVPFKPSKKHPLILSTSELTDFLRCRLRWNWRYRVGLQPRAMGGMRGIGIFIHQAKEEWYKLPLKRRSVKRMEMISHRVTNDPKIKISEKDRKLAKAMLDGFAAWALNPFNDECDANIGLVKAYPEDFIVMPITEDETILVRMKIDVRFEPTTLRRTLSMEETKTKASVNFDMLDLNHQLTTYCAGLMYKYPGYKRYQAWRTVLRRQLPTPRVKTPLFGRESIERNEEEVGLWLADTRRAARDILDSAIYPTQTDSCRWDCDFYRLCLLRSNKSDLKHTMRTEYETKREKL